MTGQLVRRVFSKMMYSSCYGSSHPGPKGTITLDTTGKQQIQGWSPGDIQFRTRRPNQSHEVAAADKTPSSAWSHSGRTCKGVEERDWRLRYSTVFLAVTDAPDDSSAVLAAIHVSDIHKCKSFNGLRNYTRNSG